MRPQLSPARREQAFHIARAIERCADWSDVAGVMGRQPPSRLPSESRRPVGASPRVGIWVSDDAAANAGTLELRRLKSVSESWAWSTTDVIPAKGKLPRVVLIGESVARGYLCEPHWNPASALGELTSATNPCIEVVDLACSGLQLPRLMELLDESLLLAPDAVLLFAGNNWAIWDADTEGRNGVGLPAAAVIDFLASGQRWQVLVEQFESCARHQVSLIVSRLSAWSATHRVPLVIVIPEVNAEWRFSNESLPMLFGRQAAGEWHGNRERAVDAIEGGDAPSARLFAERMTMIDHGGSVLSSNLLAQAAAMAGDVERSADLRHIARRTAATLLSPREPSCYPVIQTSLRDECDKQGVPVVDLPQVFKKQSHGAAPGREFFLDYCHMNIDGIAVAMSAVANQLKSTLKLAIGPSGSRQHSVDRWRVAKADTSLVAALYNAACLQPGEVIAFHCKAAVQAMPELVSSIPHIAAACLKDIPVLLRPEYRAVLETRKLSSLKSFSQIYPLLPGHAGVLDAVLALRAAASLHELPPDEFVRPDDIVAKGDVCGEPMNLLDKRWIRMGPGDLEAKTVQRSAYFRSFRPNTEFQFFLGRRIALSLELTYRTPEDIQSGTVDILVNGQLVETLPAAPDWTRATIRIPSTSLERSINRLRLSWPAGSASAASEVARISKRLKLAARFYPNVLPTVLPVWGNVSSCLITRMESA